MALDDTKTLAERILRLEQKLQRLEKREGRPPVELFDNSAIRNRKIINDLLVHNHVHANLLGLDADDHTQYLDTTRHDSTTRHTLGTVVPHDSHSSLSNLSNDDHTQYLNTTRHDTTGRHTLGTVVPHDDHGSLSGSTDDDHTQYLNNTRHDTTGRHTLGTVVPHDDHGALTGLSDDDHTQYLNTTRHDTTTRHTLGTVVPHDDHGSLSGLADDDHTQYTKHPASSTDNAIARWDGTTGRILQNSGITINDNGQLSGDGLDGWCYDTDTWTYVSATSFKITGKNVRYRFPKGTKIKLVQSGATKYFYVIATAYTSGNTIITITGGSDYALASATISGQAYSYAAAPQNFPQWFNYTPTIYTGWSALPTGTYKFYAVGNTCFYNIDQSDGTSTTSPSSNTQLGTPITAAGNQVFGGACGLAVDNGAILTGAARWVIEKSSTWVQFQKDMGTTSFTTSGTKRVRALVIYEF